MSVPVLTAAKMHTFHTVYFMAIYPLITVAVEETACSIKLMSLLNEPDTQLHVMKKSTSNENCFL